MNFCQNHTTCPLAFICTQPHNCHRKLCSICLEKHGFDEKYQININDFSKFINEKLNKVKPNYNQQQQQIKNAFSQIFNKFQKLILEMKEDCKNILENCFNLINKEDQICLNLQTSNIADLSNSDLNEIVNILEGDGLEKWQKFTSSLMIKLNQAIKNLEDQIEYLKMNHQKHNQQFISQTKLQEKQFSAIFKRFEGLQKHKGFFWNNGRYIGIEFEVGFNKNKEVKYIKDGQIIRIDQFIEITKPPIMMNNYEQINYLQWIGQYGQNNQKIGKWIITWNGEILFDLGGQYSNDGIKEGQWKEIILNYWSKAQAYESGEYVNDKRFGIWKYIYQEKEIIIGVYDQNGIKKGKWIEFSEGFSNFSKVAYHGEYNLKGQKKGKWDTMYSQQREKQYINIGGGSYNEQEESSIKFGKWIELSNGFRDASQVTYNGYYNNKGNKIGGWIIVYKGQQIGGGSYDEQEGISMKIGRWIEDWEGFWEQSQVTFEGEYNLNGNKVGKWDIIYKKDQESKQIGGGSFDEQEGTSKKIGIWREVCWGFQDMSQLLFYGEYNANGNKVGKWEMQMKECKIGGGSYEEQEGVSRKIGYWRECIDGFSDDAYVTYNGEYNKKGIKVGKWEILHQGLPIGGGLYYEIEGIQKKIGQWIEECSGFCGRNQTTYSGEYNMIGQKVGRWDVLFRRSKIGGGLYNFQEGDSKKVGQWIEDLESFNDSKQVTFEGEYNINGHKIGRWNFVYRGNKIGGGSYEEQQGAFRKIGQWTELSDGFKDTLQVTYTGEYNLISKKIGRWDTFYKEDKDYKQIGGGTYEVCDGLSRKIGQWIELSDMFQSASQITYKGEYNQNCNKVDRWDILFKGIQIGGGSYNEQNGVSEKVGSWIDISEGFWNGSQITYVGEYNMNGNKIGRWDTWFQKNFGSKKNEQIGGGSYDEQNGHSVKVGKWVELQNGFDKNDQITFTGEYNGQGKKIGIWIQMDLKENKKVKQMNYDH
ncbi:unnamed protein product [Paramecium sonneborni]|uniref:Uncharacterized protein n=1 Tax=Paramecium sonneborni TaxID=65129 RepID=A0A8S1QNS7_9CILI|nr:unnamed protein product [Paramecium sonneborni]